MLSLLVIDLVAHVFVGVFVIVDGGPQRWPGTSTSRFLISRGVEASETSYGGIDDDDDHDDVINHVETATDTDADTDNDSDGDDGSRGRHVHYADFETNGRDNDHVTDDDKIQEAGRILSVDDIGHNDEERSHRTIFIDDVDERTHLDVFAHEVKTCLTNDAAKYWNDLARFIRGQRRLKFIMQWWYSRQGDHDDPGDVDDQNSNGASFDHENLVHDDMYQHNDSNNYWRDFHLNLSIMNNDRVHSFVKNNAVRVARTLSASTQKLTEWSKPFRDNVMHRSQHIRDRTTQQVRYILRNVDDNFQSVAEKVGRGICNDLQQRCRQQQELYETVLGPRYVAPDDPTTSLLRRKPILQLAWQERLLCYRSVIVEDCLELEYV